MFSSKSLLVLAGAFGFATLAQAHSPYLLPNEFDLADRDHVSVQASFTEKFFVPDVVMKATDWHVVGPDGGRQPLTAVYTRDVAVLDVDTPKPGTYRISSGVRDGSTRKATIENGEWKFLRGDAAVATPVIEVKSITQAVVYVTRGSANDAALAPSSKGLELQLLTHPAKLLAGGELKLKVLYDGKPLAGQKITLQRGRAANGDAPPEANADGGDDGVVTLRLTDAGVYHAQLRHRFVLPGNPGKAESHTYALTFEVGE